MKISKENEERQLNDSSITIFINSTREKFWSKLKRKFSKYKNGESL
jgi:hypothetical protein